MTSFILLAVEALALLSGEFVGGDSFAVNLSAAEPVLLGLFWTQTVIVMTYLGVSVAEAMKK